MRFWWGSPRRGLHRTDRGLREHRAELLRGEPSRCRCDEGAVGTVSESAGSGYRCCLGLRFHSFNRGAGAGKVERVHKGTKIFDRAVDGHDTLAPAIEDQVNALCAPRRIRAGLAIVVDPVPGMDRGIDQVLLGVHQPPYDKSPTVDAELGLVGVRVRSIWIELPLKDGQRPVVGGIAVALGSSRVRPFPSPAGPRSVPSGWVPYGRRRPTDP